MTFCSIPSSLHPPASLVSLPRLSLFQYLQNPSVRPVCVTVCDRGTGPQQFTQSSPHCPALGVPILQPRPLIPTHLSGLEPQAVQRKNLFSLQFAATQDSREVKPWERKGAASRGLSAALPAWASQALQSLE